MSTDLKAQPRLTLCDFDPAGQERMVRELLRKGVGGWSSLHPDVRKPRDASPGEPSLWHQFAPEQRGVRWAAGKAGYHITPAIVVAQKEWEDGWGVGRVRSSDVLGRWAIVVERDFGTIEEQLGFIEEFGHKSSIWPHALVLSGDTRPSASVAAHGHPLSAGKSVHAWYLLEPCGLSAAEAAQRALIGVMRGDLALASVGASCRKPGCIAMVRGMEARVQTLGYLDTDLPRYEALGLVSLCDRYASVELGVQDSVTAYEAYRTMHSLAQRRKAHQPLPMWWEHWAKERTPGSEESIRLLDPLCAEVLRRYEELLDGDAGAYRYAVELQKARAEFRGDSSAHEADEDLEDHILIELRGVTRTVEAWAEEAAEPGKVSGSVRCPFHDDHNRSAEFSAYRGGKAFLRCHACGTSWGRGAVSSGAIAPKPLADMSAKELRALAKEKAEKERQIKESQKERNEKPDPRLLSDEEMDRLNATYAYLKDTGRILRLDKGVQYTDTVFRRLGVEERMWLESVNGARRHTYEGIRFDPQAGVEVVEDGLQYRNSFRADLLARRAVWGGESAAVGDFLAVVRNLCRDDSGAVSDVEAGWLLQWVANAVQHPEALQSGVILIGAQGTGKDTLCNILRGLFDPRYVYVLRKDELDSQFNSWVEGHLFLWANEVVGDAMRNMVSVSQRLKPYVTDRYVTVEAKGENQRTVKQFNKMLIASNSAVPIALEDTDRRWSVFRSTVRLNGEVAARVSTMLEQRDTPEGRQYWGELCGWLWDTPFEDGFDPRQPFENSARAALKSDSRDSLEEWWDDLLREMPDDCAFPVAQVWELFRVMDPKAADRLNSKALGRKRPSCLRTASDGKSRWVVRGDGMTPTGRTLGDAWIRERIVAASAGQRVERHATSRPQVSDLTN